MYRLQSNIAQKGFGLFACALKETDECIGFVGLHIPQFESHFTPCVEIGWRIHSIYQGKGYATEAARAVMQFGFEQLELEEIVSFTVPMNIKSQNVMKKLGMVHNIVDDFDHPKLAHEHPLSRHVLYRITKEQWLNKD